MNKGKKKSTEDIKQELLKIKIKKGKILIDDYKSLMTDYGGEIEISAGPNPTFSMRFADTQVEAEKVQKEKRENAEYGKRRRKQQSDALKEAHKKRKPKIKQRNKELVLMAFKLKKEGNSKCSDVAKKLAKNPEVQEIIQFHTEKRLSVHSIRAIIGPLFKK